MLYTKRRKLIIDIVMLFTLLLFSTCITIIFYFYHQSSKAVLKMGNELIEETNQIVIEKLNSFFLPLPIVQIAYLLLKDHELQQPDMNILSEFVYGILNTYPEFNSIYFTDTLGNMFYVTNLNDSTIKEMALSYSSHYHIPPTTQYINQIILKKNNENRSSLQLSYKNANGITIKTEKKGSTDYDPRIRPWYLGAKTLFNQYWIRSYILYNSKEVGLSVSFPIWINKQLVGVVGADLNLLSIANELKNLLNNNEGILFIFNSHGGMITSNDTIKTFENINSLPKIDKTENIIINKAYHIQQKFHQDNFTFLHNHKKYIAHFKVYTSSQTEPWIIGQILLLDSMLGEINQANNNITVFSLFMLILGLIFVILFSKKISIPIMQLAEETKDLVNLEFHKKINIKTHIYEVQIMLDALNSAKSALFSFSKYVPKVLVKQLLKSKKIAQVGGEMKNLSILFTDIADFGGVATQLDPKSLMIHMSEYINTLAPCIQAQQGLIDKYIGDSIMAFWGAPLDDPDHAIHACLATLACRDLVNKLNKNWLAEGKPCLITRFGISTGLAIVGNMGSRYRLNYTVLGDTVNIASRLEQLNKIFNTQIIVDENTYELCNALFLFKCLGQVKIKSKKGLHFVYELIGLKGLSS